MKKAISIFITVMLLLCACSSWAEQSVSINTFTSTSMPVNQLTEDFEQEGEEGVVLFADPSEALPETKETQIAGFIPADLDKADIDPFDPDNAKNTRSVSFSEDDAEKVIIGSDDRVTVKKPGEYPYSTIANMKVTAECGDKWECTGFMVGRNCLMTAAHCMVCTDHGKWAKNVTFYFGYKNSKNYLYKYTGGWFARAGTLFPNRRYDSDAMDDDWCYVILNKNVGDKTGWFGMNFATDKQITSGKFKVAGYRDNKLKYCWGNASVYSNELIFHNADDMPGNSGGPIFRKDDYASAIIIAGSDALKTNLGRRITSDIWSYMQKDGYK